MVKVPSKAVTVASVVCQERRTEVGQRVAAPSWCLLTAALRHRCAHTAGLLSGFSEAVCDSGPPACPCLQYMGSVFRSVLAVTCVLMPGSCCRAVSPHHKLQFPQITLG